LPGSSKGVDEAEAAESAADVPFAAAAPETSVEVAEALVGVSEGEEAALTGGVDAAAVGAVPEGADGALVGTADAGMDENPLTEMIALPVADGVADGVPGALDGLAVPDPVADGAPVATEAATTVENPLTPIAGVPVADAGVAESVGAGGAELPGGGTVKVVPGEGADVSDGAEGALEGGRGALSVADGGGALAVALPVSDGGGVEAAGGGGVPPAGGSVANAVSVHVFSICTRSSPFWPFMGVMRMLHDSVMGPPFTCTVSVVVKDVGASNRTCARRRISIE